MKPLVLLLSLVVLALSGIPCCGLAEASASAIRAGQADLPEKPFEKPSESPFEKNDDCCKDCCPFYICTGCAGFVVSDYFTISYVWPPQSRTGYSDHLPLKLNQITVSIWQPPKLS